MQRERQELERLPEERRTALVRLLAQRAGRPAIPRCADADVPLSSAQRRIWFAEQLSPDAGMYNTPVALRLRGALDVPALDRALREVVNRHEVLRSCVQERDGVAVQTVGVVPATVLRLVDLSAAGDREAAARSHASSDAALLFDLGRGPLLRALLLRLATDDHVLAITVHHIAADAPSFEILFRELEALYGAFTRGNTCSLPELPIQYRDFAAWQLAWLAGEERADLVDHWRRALEGAPYVLEVVGDRPRPARREASGRFYRARYPADLANRVSALAAEERTTPFVVLLTSFAVLLSRYTGQDDLLIGVPSSGRTHAELEPLVGCFLNMLCVRVDLRRAAGVRQALHRVHTATFDAFAHQALPFEELVRVLRPPRTATHTPLFQVAFSAGTEAERLPRLPNLAVEHFELEGGASPWDLGFDVVDDGRGLAAVWAYRDDMFDEETVARVSRNFEHVVGDIVERPARALARVSAVTPAERDLQLVEWNPSERSIGERPIHVRFREQAAARPDAIAVACGATETTYRALERTAGAIARALQERRLGAEAPVPVLLDRTPLLPATLLGVAWAGAASVPLDPEHPWERIAYVLRDLGSRVVVSKRAVAERLPRDLDLLLVDAELGSDDGDELPAAPAVSRDALAYIVYTSGSTGRPKGVAVTHGALANVLGAFAAEHAVGPGDSLLAVTTVAFDISMLELLLPLSCGARVVVASRETARDGRALAELVQRAGATIVQATPATWRLLAEAGWKGGDVRALSGGEILPAPLAAALVSRTPLWNVYGPSETTIWSTAHRVEDVVPPAPVPIGRPIRNTRVYVLDRDGGLAPVGATGEICIGGSGLARGYVGRPGLTARAFVPDPFAERPGSRLYRTGDAGRWRADGTLEFVGRLDDQLKIRGFRVEPAEVERALREEAGVRDAAVVAIERDGVSQLVAYLETDAEPVVSALRGSLARVLPDYLVPELFVRVEALPRNASGKIDRKRLRDLDGERVGTGSPWIAPEGMAARAIAGTWREVLGIERVGATENFFDLGGDSLTLTRLRARLEDAFGVAVPLVDLMDRATVRDHAAIVERLVTDQVAAMSEADAARALAAAEAASRVDADAART